MSQIPPVAPDELPVAPHTNEPLVFSPRMDDFLGAMDPFRGQLIALGENTYDNAVDAYTSAVAAAASAAAAAGSATTAAGIVAAAGAILWVSNTTYAINDNRVSTLDWQVYKRKTVGAGTTDPKNDPTNWERVLFGPGIGGTTLTGSVTLVNTSPGAMTVTPVSPGLYATLPNSTTCSKGATLFSIYNAGDFDYGVKDSTGAQIGWIRPQTGVIIGLADNTSAAGVWSAFGMEKTGITAMWAYGSLANTGTIIQRIALDANRTCFLIGDTTIYAIVYNASTQSWGNPTAIDAAITSGTISGILSAADQILVTYFDTTHIYSKTLSFSGTTVSVNGVVSSVLSGNFQSSGVLTAVGSSFVISYGYASTTNSAIRAITVSGATPTLGSEALVVTTTTAAANLYVTGSVVRAIVASASLLTVKPYTVSGSTLTAGTAATATTSAPTFRSIMNGNGNIVVVYANSNTSASIFKLTGTVEAVSTAVITTQVFYTLAQSDIAVVTNSKLLIIMSPVATSAWYANILTDTAGTASVGTMMSRPSNGNITDFSVIATVVSSMVRIAYKTNLQIAQWTLDCSGSSPAYNNIITVYTNGLTVGNCSASDSYGVRSPNNLYVGNHAVLIGGGNTSGDTYLNPYSMNRRPPLQLLNQSNIGVVGANTNESWFGGILLGSTGFAINRVEMAQ